MRLELPAMKNRREILNSPELLRINAEGVTFSIFTKSLLITLLILLYSMLMVGTVGNLISDSPQVRSKFLIPVLIFAVLATAGFIFSIFLIIKTKQKTLIFTRTGIAFGLAGIKYAQLETYRWEISSGVLATGQSLKKDKITLLLDGPKGLFSGPAYTVYGGMSILGVAGFFFDEEQIRRAEEILNGFGLRKLADKTQ